MLKVKAKELVWDSVVETGTRSAFSTGSQRDTQEGKGRPDLIPIGMLKRLATHYENGAKKYGDNNWQKGQKLSQYYNSAMRHLWKILELDLTEDHFAAAIWNVTAMMHHIDAIRAGTLPPELDDIGMIKQLDLYERGNKSPTAVEALKGFGDSLTQTQAAMANIGKQLMHDERSKQVITQRDLGDETDR